MPYRYLKLLYSQSYDSYQENQDRNSLKFDKADKIVTWLVGFSIGIFTLILSSEDNSPQIQEIKNELLIISLLVTISGLIFRVISFYTQITVVDIGLSFKSHARAFKTKVEIPEPREINEQDTTEEIIQFLKDDFNLQDITIIDTIEFNLLSKEMIRSLYKNYYETLAKNNDVELQEKQFFDNIALHYGISKRNRENLVTNMDSLIKRRGILFQVLKFLSKLFFFLTLGIFATGTSLLLLNVISNYC